MLLVTVRAGLKKKSNENKLKTSWLFTWRVPNQHYPFYNRIYRIPYDFSSLTSVVRVLVHQIYLYYDHQVEQKRWKRRWIVRYGNKKDSLPNWWLIFGEIWHICARLKKLIWKEEEKKKILEINHITYVFPFNSQRIMLNHIISFKLIN
jgi:hypothetical protein